MAIFIEGMKCPLCGHPMKKGQETVSFPLFVANEADPLFRFNDRVFHRECFEKEPLAEIAKARYAEVLEQSKPENRRCRVCGKIVIDPDDYLSFGHLTENKLHPLHRFNYIHFHRSCLHQWSELRQVVGVAEGQMESGAWKGAGMRWILKALREAVNQGG